MVRDIIFSGTSAGEYWIQTPAFQQTIRTDDFCVDKDDNILCLYRTNVNYGTAANGFIKISKYGTTLNVVSSNTLSCVKVSSCNSNSTYYILADKNQKIVKFNSSLDSVIWSKSFSSSNGSCNLKNILISSNTEDIYCAGFSTYDSSKTIAVQKLNKDGNVIWQKLYLAAYHDFSSGYKTPQIKMCFDDIEDNIFVASSGGNRSPIYISKISCNTGQLANNSVVRSGYFTNSPNLIYGGEFEYVISGIEHKNGNTFISGYAYDTYDSKNYVFVKVFNSSLNVTMSQKYYNGGSQSRKMSGLGVLSSGLLASFYSGDGVDWFGAAFCTQSGSYGGQFSLIDTKILNGVSYDDMTLLKNDIMYFFRKVENTSGYIIKMPLGNKEFGYSNSPINRFYTVDGESFYVKQGLKKTEMTNFFFSDFSDSATFLSSNTANTNFSYSNSNTFFQQQPLINPANHIVIQPL